jgi:uncharacterized protein (UPF0335 family)
MSINVAADQLRLFIERVETLEAEAESLSKDRLDVFAEAKANGFCAKTMREIIKLRKKDKHVLQEEDAMLETYRAALGIE